MNFVRFLMLLAPSVWIGGLIFFPVVAQISFSQLPSPQLAGIVVRGSLIALHWIGLIGGVVFLTCSLLEAWSAHGQLALFRPSHIIVALMLSLTAISQFSIIPKMDALRSAATDISSLPADSPIRRQFEYLHTSSARIEEAVLLLGLVLLYLTSRQLASAARA